MWGHKPKIRPVDTLFSKYIRERANWKCEVCGRDYSQEHQKLDCCHYKGRGRESTRFDPQNCIAACKGCHWKFHEDKRLHDEFMLKRLGQRDFDLLVLRSNSKGHKDDALTKLYIIKLTEEL